MSEEAEVVIPSAVFPGKAFTEARQQLGLSEDQVARQLHLPDQVVESIERSDLDRLKNPVFSRGYIRAYARFLKLDADAMVAAYNQQTGNLSTTGRVKAIGTVSTVPGRRQGHPVLKVGSWLFILALVAASAWWWQAQFGFDEGERSALNDLPVSVETTDGTTLVLPQLHDEEPEPVNETDVLDMRQADPEGAGLVSEPSGDEGELPGTDPVADAGQVLDEATTEEAAGVAEAEPPFSGLALSFSADCWLSVKDARGRMLYSGVAKGGSSLELEGDEPLAVVIGRVSAVGSIRYADKPIDLASFSADNVARLRLPM